MEFDRICELLTTKQEHSNVFFSVLNHWGVDNWVLKLQEFIAQLDAAYGNEVGNFLVSPVILKRAVDFFHNAKVINNLELKTYLNSVCEAKNEFSTSGTSKASICRILSIGVKAGVLKIKKQGKLTRYEFNKTQSKEATYRKILGHASKKPVQNIHKRVMSTASSYKSVSKREKLDRMCEVQGRSRTENVKVSNVEEGKEPTRTSTVPVLSSRYPNGTSHSRKRDTAGGYVFTGKPYLQRGWRLFLDTVRRSESEKMAKGGVRFKSSYEKIPTLI